MTGDTNMAALEHVNLTVRDPRATAELLCTLFDWNIRWQGEAIDGGLSVHVGNDSSYLALYRPAPGRAARPSSESSYRTINGLNHVGILVDDLDAAERCICDAGFNTHNHADYEPGRRFYFNAIDELEIEVISYEK
jgi:hypothetical protein